MLAFLHFWKPRDTFKLVDLIHNINISIPVTSHSHYRNMRWLICGDGRRKLLLLQLVETTAEPETTAEGWFDEGPQYFNICNCQTTGFFLQYVSMHWNWTGMDFASSTRQTRRLMLSQQSVTKHKQLFGTLSHRDVIRFCNDLWSPCQLERMLSLK